MALIEHHCPEVLVTEKAVYFDGQELPWHIAQDGISFKPGGRDDINRLTVEFLVGTTTFEDTWEVEHQSEWRWLLANVRLDHWLALGEFIRIEEEFDVRG
ncbi:hypothetical protein TRIXIE_41 [Mycobacterium phage Trixie]|uniref:Uncharacterized protein n=1 Tax=Mycobacterium phage Trixie TaxID=1071503 RepID=G1JV91_9CAUD|nr:hypothetical protein TRIXIE_41 [Mycobacterium phage Trixie]AEL17918.1 hypothetical protein TRIXIE_41 [Mycobacterium phage Trixie]